MAKIFYTVRIITTQYYYFLDIYAEGARAAKVERIHSLIERGKIENPGEIANITAVKL